MRRNIIHLAKGAFLFLGVFSISSVNASMADKAYAEIVARNVFRLRAAAPAMAGAPVANQVPRSKITLTGITSILGRNMALLTIAGIRPGAPSESVMLAEGQAANEVEVRNIDARAGTVQVINRGERQILDFEHNGAKASDAPAVPQPKITLTAITPILGEKVGHERLLPPGRN